MRTRVVLAVMALVVAAGVGAGIWFLLSGGPSAGQADASRSFPPGARSAVRLLLSSQGRQALTPELNASLPHGPQQLFPAGSRFIPQATGWHQAGAFANVTGTLSEPHKPAQRTEIGLVDRHGRWLVTFAETL